MATTLRDTRPTDTQDGFLATKEYKRFAEFCDACHRFRYIGLCYGLPGVGKTVSARKYANWHWFDGRKNNWRKKEAESKLPSEEALNCSTLVYTAEVAGNAKRLSDQLQGAMDRFDDIIEDALDARSTEERTLADFREHTELIIVDEADRLKLQSLEQLRDTFDRSEVGLVLLGMPGMEMRLSRYPQLYSRIGFVHEFKSLSQEEMVFILEHKWSELGLNLKADDFVDIEAMSAVARITQGNFRLLQRLIAQIERLLAINGFKLVSKELVEVARESLVIGIA